MCVRDKNFVHINCHVIKYFHLTGWRVMIIHPLIHVDHTGCLGSKTFMLDHKLASKSSHLSSNQLKFVKTNKKKKNREFLTANDSIALSQKSSPTRFYRWKLLFIPTPSSFWSCLVPFLLLPVANMAAPMPRWASPIFSDTHTLFFWSDHGFSDMGFFFAVWRGGMLVPSPWIRCEMPWSG